MGCFPLARIATAISWAAVASMGPHVRGLAAYWPPHRRLTVTPITLASTPGATASRRSRGAEAPAWLGVKCARYSDSSDGSELRVRRICPPRHFFVTPSCRKGINTHAREQGSWVQHHPPASRRDPDIPGTLVCAGRRLHEDVSALNITRSSDALRRRGFTAQCALRSPPTCARQLPGLQPRPFWHVRDLRAVRPERGSLRRAAGVSPQATFGMLTGGCRSGALPAACQPGMATDLQCLARPHNPPSPSIPLSIPFPLGCARFTHRGPVSAARGFGLI
jgi:hypothetical protein